MLVTAPATIPRLRRPSAVVALVAALTTLVMLPALARPDAAQAIQSTITYVGGGVATTASGTSLSVPGPAAKQVGDLLVMQVEASGTGVITLGSSFITIPGATGVSSNNDYVITAYKLATGSGLSNISVSWTGNREAVGTLLDYSGVDNVNPIENIGSLAGGIDPLTGTGTTFSVPSVTTTDPNSVVLGVALAWPTVASLTTTAPSGTMTRSSAAAAQTTASPYSDITPFDSVVASPGATAVATGTFSTSTAWEVTALALRPAQVVFSTPPAVGSLGAVTLTGAQQVKHAQLGSFAVTDTRGTTGANWTVTVQGASGTGLSPVFKQYCPNPGCGSDSGPGYITGGATLPAGSLTLSTSGASWTGGVSGTTAPVFACTASPCVLDGSSAATVASDTNGLGTWTGAGLSASSLSLTVPVTARVFANPGEVYRADLLWTLSSGP